MARRGPKPRVEYDGRVYSCRSYDVDIPDLETMDRFAALIWLNRHTVATGAGTRTKPEPNLAGLHLEVR